MKIKFRKGLILSLLATLMVTSGFSCKIIPVSERELLEPIQITWWGVVDNPEDFNQIIRDYRALHPNVSISYRKLRMEEYEQELLNALAEDRGPDIISVHNTWVREYETKLEPLPPTTKMAYQVQQKSLGIKQEVITEIRESRSLTTADIRNNFIDVVYDDVVINNSIMALPLSVDTMVLFYNRDLFNSANIPLPPTDWLTLQDNASRLTVKNQEFQILQAGVALGTADNVERSHEILSLLMMQNGAQMTQGRSVTFGAVPPGATNRDYNPGPEALRFYTDFANETKQAHAWSETFPNSLDVFSQGQVAMMFGYQYHIPILEAKRQGKLNYAISKMPQIAADQQGVNYANYWAYGVSKKSEHINEAWDFIQFMTGNKIATKYLEETGKPTALRGLVDAQKQIPELAVFADQLLTAKSWYHGQDAAVFETAMKEMIKNYNDGATIKEVFDLAKFKIEQTL